MRTGISRAVKEGTLIYRFAKEGVYTKWNEALKLQRADVAYNFIDSTKVEQYWRQVMEDCVLMPLVENLDELPLLQANLYSNLRRKGAWYRHYHLLRPQQAFLYKTLSLGVDRTVIDDADLLLRISRASLTPVNILKRYYQRRCAPVKANRRSSGINARASNTIGSKATQKSTTGHQQAIQGTTLTARQANAIKKKALLVQKERLVEFDNVLETCFGGLNLDDSARKVISEGLVNIRREYGRGEAGLTLKRVRHMFEDVMKLHKAGEQTWDTIVDRKKYPRASSSRTDESEGGKKKAREAAKSRKAAIEWTKARDELLRDAIVILRCRDRHRNPAYPRKNWKALEQIFPDSSASSLKKRFDNLCKAVGEEAYLSQLEAKWDNLWATKRGTEELEDLDPKNPTDFDLMEHIRFLRSNINKLAVADKVDNETGDPLPLDVGKMLDLFDYERPYGIENFDVYSTLTRYSLAEESVEKRTQVLREHAFTLGSNALYYAMESSMQDDYGKKLVKRQRGKAIALVKIIQCTSDTDYDKDVATQLYLDNSEEEIVDKAIKELQNLKIIKRIAKEEREMPNRSFTFTPEYVNFHQDSTLETLPFWDIARGYSKILERGQDVVFRQSENEESAAYLTLLSQDQVKANVDLSVVEKIKMDKLFNAKLIQDHMLEIPIHLETIATTSKLDSIRRCAALLDSQPDSEPILQWLDSEADSLSNRVDKVWKQWIGSLKGEKQSVVRILLAIFHDEENDGMDGISKEELKLLCPSKYLKSLLQAAQGFSPPLLFQHGYGNTALLISARYLSSWTIRFQSNNTHAFPYKWYDIHGKLNQQEWTQALQLVIHAILTRPGITLAQLLLQFCIALDRPELIRIIHHASEAGVIRIVLSSNEQVQGNDAEWEARNDSQVALIAA